MSTVRGFDISHYNAVAKYLPAMAAGYRFVYLKATEGEHYTDPMFDERKAGAAQARLPAGAYLFLQPDQNVAKQVQHFVEVVGDDMPLRPALDHETRSSRGRAATAAAAREAAALLFDHYGYAPLLYCDRSFITEGLCDGLGTLPLWIADYSGGVTGAGRHAGARQTAHEARIGTARKAGLAPHVPPGPWSTWAVWQTGQATVPGVSGGDGPATDVNVCPDLEALYAPSISPAPIPQPPAPHPAADSEDNPMLVIRAKDRIAAVVDSAAIGHPVSSAKWSALNHTADKGAGVDIITLDDAADWDAYVPTTGAHARKGATPGEIVDENGNPVALDAYDPFTHPDTGRALPDRRNRAVYTTIVNNPATEATA